MKPGWRNRDRHSGRGRAAAARSAGSQSHEHAEKPSLALVGDLDDQGAKSEVSLILADRWHAGQVVSEPRILLPPGNGPLGKGLNAITNARNPQTECRNENERVADVQSPRRRRRAARLLMRLIRHDVVLQPSSMTTRLATFYKADQDDRRLLPRRPPRVLTQSHVSVNLKCIVGIGRLDRRVGSRPFVRLIPPQAHLDGQFPVDFLSSGRSRFPHLA